jgi:hypothetical protein
MSTLSLVEAVAGCMVKVIGEAEYPISPKIKVHSPVRVEVQLIPWYDKAPLICTVPVGAGGSVAKDNFADQSHPDAEISAWATMGYQKRRRRTNRAIVSFRNGLQ